MIIYRKVFDLILTEVRIVLLKHRPGLVSGKKKTKRDIKITNLKGITKSTIKNAHCLVLHVNNSHDELLYTDKSEKIIENIK